MIQAATHLREKAITFELTISIFDSSQCTEYSTTTFVPSSPSTTGLSLSVPSHLQLRGRCNQVKEVGTVASRPRFGSDLRAQTLQLGSYEPAEPHGISSTICQSYFLM